MTTTETMVITAHSSHSVHSDISLRYSSPLYSPPTDHPLSCRAENGRLLAVHHRTNGEALLATRKIPAGTMDSKRGTQKSEQLRLHSVLAGIAILYRQKGRRSSNGILHLKGKLSESFEPVNPLYR